MYGSGAVQEFGLGRRYGERFAQVYDGRVSGGHSPSGVQGQKLKDVHVLRCPKEGEIWLIVNDFSVALLLVQQTSLSDGNQSPCQKVMEPG